MVVPRDARGDGWTTNSLEARRMFGLFKSRLLSSNGDWPARSRGKTNCGEDAASVVPLPRCVQR